MEGAIFGMKLFLGLLFCIPPIALGIFGGLLFKGRGLFLLAAYSELLAPNQKRVRKELGPPAGKLSFLLAGCSVLWPVGIFTWLWLFWLGALLFLCVLAGGMFYLSRKYFSHEEK